MHNVIKLVNSTKLDSYVSDNNECTLNTDLCDQNCQNTDGGYTCSCNTGYTLDRDRQSCFGTCI